MEDAAWTALRVHIESDLSVEHTRRVSRDHFLETVPSLVRYPAGVTVEFRVIRFLGSMYFVDIDGWAFSEDAILSLSEDGVLLGVE